MEGIKITIDELARKGYVRDDVIGMSDVYVKEHTWGKKVLLYHRDRGEVLINTRVPYRLKTQRGDGK